MRRICAERELAFTLAGAGLAFLAPRRAETALVKRALRVAGHAHKARLAALEDLIGRYADPQVDAEQAARNVIGLSLEYKWGRACGLRRRGWNPAVDVVGLEHVSGGYQAGRGTILWQMSFGPPTVFHNALADAGFPLVHLSSPNHLATYDDWWAVHVASPLLRTGECRRLAERIEVSTDGSLGYLKAVADRLATNAVVSIRGDMSKGRINVAAPLLGFDTYYPTGAPALAHRTGAVLLPIATMRVGVNRYQVVIEPPIGADRSLLRGEFRQRAVREYAARLDRRVRLNPGSWRGWSALARRDSASSPHRRVHASDEQPQRGYLAAGL